jgi:hypothetical protein
VGQGGAEGLGARGAPLFLVIAAVALCAFAFRGSAETGAPALEFDGVWRAHGDWTVNGGDQVLHLNESVEVAGNLTVEGGAHLELANVSIVFPANTNVSRAIRVEQDGLLLLRNVSLLARNSNDTVIVRGGEFVAQGSTLAFEGQAGKARSMWFENSVFGLNDSTVVTDAVLALEARTSDVEAMDSQLINWSGGASDILLGGPALYNLDTTKFGTLFVEDRPTVVLYSTVRFFLFDTSGGPAAGRVNGTGAFGELFFLDTAPNATASMRLTWLDLVGTQTNLTAGERRSAAPVQFTAVSEGVGGNTTTVNLDRERVNVTVVLDGTFDLAVEAPTVLNGTLETLGLRRAYYVSVNETSVVLVRVTNRGFAPSPATTIAVVRLALNGSSWRIEGERALVSLAVPPLDPGAVVNFTVPLTPGNYGGFLDAGGTCTSSTSYASAVSVRIEQPGPGDFRPWDDGAESNVIAYDVHPAYGPSCPTPTADALPFLAAGAIAAVTAVALITRFFSEGQVAKRAVKRERAKRPPP